MAENYPTATQRSSNDQIIKKPTYTLTEAARYLHQPRSTVASWVHGRAYAHLNRDFAPAIVMADPDSGLLSFENLIEIHVLSALRRKHEVPLPRIRLAMLSMRAFLDTDHPLASPGIFTDGKDVFVRLAGRLLNASERGQYAIQEALDLYLQRVDRDPANVPIRLYPLFGRHHESERRSVAIDPRYRLGAPFIVSASIPTSVVAERVRAGEPVRAVAEDYRCTVEAVRDAVEFERRPTAA